MRHLSPCAALIAVTCLAGSAAAQTAPAAPASPEEQNAGDVAAARALGVEGVRAADAGDCNDAVDKLTRAEKLHHAVSTLARLGECQVTLGKLVEGTENLQKAVRETLPPNAPEAFVAAQERARKVLAEAKPKVARLKIAVAAPPGTQIMVKVDGENVPAANLNTNRMVNPGEHVVEATAPGFLKATSKVKLAEGGSDSVAFTLEADPNAPKVDPSAAPGAPGAAAGGDHPASPAREPNRVPVYVAGGVGIVGLALGAGFGFAAMSAKSDLDKTCNTNKACPASSSDKLDSAKTLGTISTVGFIVGAVGAVAAVTLYFVDFSGGARASTASTGGRLGAYVGPGSAGLRGSF
jgi:hypothetical protein